MKKSLPIISALITYLFLMGCANDKPVDRKAVLEEMANRELKRVSQSEIIEEAKKIGDKIAQAAQEKLQENLLQSISDSGIRGAMRFCTDNASEILTSLDFSKDIQVMRVSQKFRNPENEPDSLELLILEAYEYSAENGIALESTVQPEGREVLMYTKPITISNGLCLQCHGTIGGEINEEDYAVIEATYPEDRAVSYQLNDLRGMWVIRIPKREVIRAL
ncbi:MAG: hypothetical protein ACI9RP_001091 [Cyclobacteriaceae bacterium]|jgi:hypothetical protein